MSITLTPETENRLREQAERIGKDADSPVEAIITDGPDVIISTDSLKG